MHPCRHPHPRCFVSPRAPPQSYLQHLFTASSRLPARLAGPRSHYLYDTVTVHPPAERIDRCAAVRRFALPVLMATALPTNPQPATFNPAARLCPAPPQLTHTRTGPPVLHSLRAEESRPERPGDLLDERRVRRETDSPTPHPRLSNAPPPLRPTQPNPTQPNPTQISPTSAGPLFFYFFGGGSIRTPFAWLNDLRPLEVVTETGLQLGTRAQSPRRLYQAKPHQRIES